MDWLLRYHFDLNFNLLFPMFHGSAFSLLYTGAALASPLWGGQ